MKGTITWNNARRSFRYWGSVYALLFLNIFARDMGTLSIYHFFDFGKNVFHLVVTYLLLALIGVGVVALYNYILKFLPRQIKKNKKLLLRFVFNSCFMGDIILGVVLLVSSFFSMIVLKEEFALTVVFFWVILAAVSIALYYGSIISWKTYKEIRDVLVKDNKYEESLWIGITNGQYELSAFNMLPKNGKPPCRLIDEHDLDIIGEKCSTKIDIRAFRYYLIVLDDKAPINDTFQSHIKLISKLPHAHLVVWHRAEIRDQKAIALISQVRDCKNVVIEELQNVDIDDRILSTKLTEMGFPQIGNGEFPPRFLNNSAILQQYYSLINEPAMCHNFLVIILQKLSLKPSIYALFDYIDLQYRIMVAYVISPDSAWLRDNSTAVGNINKMRSLLGEERFTKSSEEMSALGISNLDSFLVPSEYQLIRGYLPNYEKKDNLYAITYLSAALRNVLRGHGTFKDSDTQALFELVFKLALLNVCLLQTNRLEIKCSSERFWQDNPFYSAYGSFRNEETKCLSPFIIGDANHQESDYLVFNNYHIQPALNNLNQGSEETHTIEYVDYLSGKLILPKFLQVELQTNVDMEKGGG